MFQHVIDIVIDKVRDGFSVFASVVPQPPLSNTVLLFV